MPTAAGVRNISCMGPGWGSCDARDVCVSRRESLMVDGPRLLLPLRLVCVVALGVVPWHQWIHPSFRPKDNWHSFSHCVVHWMSASIVLMVTIPRRLWGRDARCLASATMVSMSGVLFRWSQVLWACSRHVRWRAVASDVISLRGVPLRTTDSI